MGKIILLVCNTRTGSTALGKSLAASNAGVLCSGEAFSAAATQQEGSFAYWLHNQRHTAEELFCRKLSIIDKYFDWIEKNYPCDFVVMDVKYHDIPGLMPIPSLYDFPPVLFEAARHRNGVILHLVRENKFESALSELVANHTGIFHLAEDVERKTIEPIIIDWGVLETQITMRELQERIVRRQVSHSHLPYAEIRYEDIFGDARDKSLQKIEELIHHRLLLSKILNQKLNRNYMITIKNYNEILEKYQQRVGVSIWENYPK